jgi:hypothetical protein
MSSMAPQSEALREAVGVFPSAGYLQAAIDELLSSGFRRAELSLLAGEDVVTTGGLSANANRSWRAAAMGANASACF